MRNVMIIPFAFFNGYNTGMNVNKEKSLEIYMKNICVSAVSASINGECEVAVVTNIDIPDRYKTILSKYNVSIIVEPFDMFRFETNELWYLAFYKLCAFYKISHKKIYDNIICVDTDTFVQGSLNNIFLECNENILLYDINHGLEVNDYRIILEEFTKYFGEKKMITHYGGEFIAANNENAVLFSECCLEVFNNMVENSVSTTKGDEFITSLAAYTMREKIKNGGAYIYRYWTDTGFRLVSTNYCNNAVSILHLPNEKERGIIKIYDSLIKTGELPQKEKVWKICMLTGISMRKKLRCIANRLIRK